MTKYFVTIGTALLITTVPLHQSAKSAQPADPAQSPQSAPGPFDCEQIRQAVAQFGYAAARRHALLHYGKDAVKYGDQCLAKMGKPKK